MKLVYQDKAGKKKNFPLSGLTEVLIGRHRDCGLRTDNPSVSRRHAKMTLSDGGWTVEDLGSSNHTFVNGAEVQSASFSAGDTVRCGEFVMKVVETRVERKDSEAPAPKENSPAPQGGSIAERRARRAALEEEREKRRRERAERRARERNAEADPGDEAQAASARDPMQDAEIQAESIPPSPDSEASGPAEASAQPGDAPASGRESNSEENKRKKELEERRARRRASSETIDASLGASVSRPGQPAPSRAGGSRELREAKEQVGSLKRDLAESQVRVEELTTRVHELEQREARHEEELDGWHDRYNRAREQVDHAQSLVEETRAELEDASSRVEELEARVVELEGQIGSIEARHSEEAGLLTELKTKLVQKDRRIDELQRELDLMEYDLRGAREELESLQDSFNQDNSQQRQLEREQELLREIMSEKENVIGDLKMQLEDKDREIYDLKMGTGVMDLEQAKSDVLEKYFDKNRECDELTEKLRAAERDGSELASRIEELEGRLSDSKDIADHPDFKRKSREVERAQSDLAEAREAYEKLENRLGDFGPEAKGKLDAQINFLERKNTALQEKLDTARSELESIRSSEAASASETPQLPQDGATGKIGRQALSVARALEKHSALSELFSGWRANLKLLQSYMDELAEVVDQGADPSDSLESAGEVLTVLTTDTKDVRRELREMESILTE